MTVPSLPDDPRQPTAIDAIADTYLDGYAALSPTLATQMGIAGYDDQLDDFSPDGEAARADLARQALRDLATATPHDDVDRVTMAALRERLGLDLELFDAAEYTRSLNNLTTPIQGCRDVFDLMATDSVTDWEVVARRLGAIPAALTSYLRSLDRGRADGHVPALRQVRVGITQARELAAAGSYFDRLAEQAAVTLPAPLATELRTNATAARAAYDDVADYLATHLAPVAPTADGVGRDRYTLWSRYFLGSTVDLEATYAWGLAELDRIIAEQQALVKDLYGSEVTIPEAYERLDADPAYIIEGKPALEAWMNETCSAAVSALDGTYADLPGPVKRLIGRIAPTELGGIYYTGPTEDFARPGTMWWSVPPGVNRFHTWRERTTVYHEGVPGHHLQVAYATYIKDRLNRWRRLGIWVSGHGEGWALYAEALMDRLGFLPTPGDRLGMLDGQRLRAARVALDIGVHLGLPFPQAWGGGGVWDATKALDFLHRNVAMNEGFIQFELDRYLGWPGQAPSYKIGQRIWESLRDDAEQRALAEGRTFDLKAFHMSALALGALGLDTLRDVMAGRFNAPTVAP